MLALHEGNLPAARSWLEAHDRWLACGGSVPGRSEGQVLWAVYHRAAGASARARASATEALAHATDPRQPLALLAAHRLLGELDTEARRFDAALMHLNASCALADACAAPYERVLTLLALAEMRAATDEQDEAARLLDEARSILTPLEAKPALARTDVLRARIAPRAAVGYRAGLTAREIEVLRLLAAGHTNRQIAHKLFLSERTIHVHVRNIFTKTSTDNRAAATAFAFRHNLA
jgi:DNA-binding CsgD family transcriptional regulator